LALTYKELGDLENAKKEAMAAADLDPRYKNEVEQFIQELEK